MPLDSHLHLPVEHPELLGVLEALDLRLLNICVSYREDWTRQREAYRRLHERHPGRYSWCTSFDMPGPADFADPSAYAARCIASIDEDIAAGAVACKIWKNIGMEILHPDGRFLMPDDALFAPIYEHLADRNVTLLCHCGEPLACWRPLVDDNPHYGYYKHNPEWHMHGREGFPSHPEIMAARDRLLANHPRLRVVGAHFGSHEYDVSEVARRLDRYPNFAVDTSARLLDLTYQDLDTARAFFRDYQDRILWGTDIVVGDLNASAASGIEDFPRKLAWMRQTWESELRFYHTNETFTYRERQVQGLGLEKAVLAKLLEGNARHWYPALAA